jgi:predicted nucleic acid-binding protein
MVPDDHRGRRVLLDACCLINFFASGRVEDILSALPYHFCIAEKVAEEALYILPEGGNVETPSEPDAISLAALTSGGLAEIMRPESEEEQAAYVNFAAVLDDGEAMTCALAVLRSCDVATDERKAIRVLGERASHVDVHTTVALVKEWADLVGASPQAVRQTLESIRTRGRFRPGTHEPLLQWWESALLHN